MYNTEENCWFWEGLKCSKGNKHVKTTSDENEKLYTGTVEQKAD